MAIKTPEQYRAMVYMVKIPRPRHAHGARNQRKFSFLNPMEHSRALNWLDEQNIVYTSSHYQITNSEEMIEMLSGVGDVVQKKVVA